MIKKVMEAIRIKKLFVDNTAVNKTMTIGNISKGLGVKTLSNKSLFN